MKKIFRLFGIPVASITYDGFDDETYISNVGGSYELASEPAEYDEDEEYYEDRGFGFGVQK